MKGQATWIVRRVEKGATTVAVGLPRQLHTIPNED
jgi:hypothetical protein